MFHPYNKTSIGKASRSFHKRKNSEYAKYWLFHSSVCSLLSMGNDTQFLLFKTMKARGLH